MGYWKSRTTDNRVGNRGGDVGNWAILGLAKESVSISFAVTVFCIPILFLSTDAFAQTYKCKQEDGKTVYLDQPCQSGSTGSPVNTRVSVIKQPDSSNEPKLTTGRRPAIERDPQNQQIEAQIRKTEEQNRQVEAHNKSVRCNEARRNLGVLKEQRPVFHYDKNGEKIYHDDSSRPTELAAAQQKVAEYCD